jgi:ABC-type Mn2+/Zn2+ transport system permease subunit
VLLGITVLATARAGAQAPTRALGAARVGAQVVAGTGALPIGYVAGGLGTRWVARRLGASDDAASQAGYLGAYAGSVLATAGGVSLVGARGPGRGSFPAAVGGTLVGGAGSVLLVRLFRRDDAPSRACRIGCVAASALILALPSIGATVAYDVARHAR